MGEEFEFIERRIVTGLIVSREYCDRVQQIWDPSYLESPEVRKVASWCMEYFKKYRRAPDEDIEAIYMEHQQAGELTKAESQYIERLLAGLSEEYGRAEQFNSAYLFDQTVKYFKARKLARHNEEIQSLVDAGRVEEAEQLARNYQPSVLDELARGLELSSPAAAERVEKAFDFFVEPLIRYPGALGAMLNDQLVRGGFVAFMAPEKRGKTWWLLELALRAIRNKCNVAFFEAGDMTENQILRRICIYLAHRSDQPKYCEAHWRPVGDCIFNQVDTCTRPDRNCDHGPFPGREEEVLRAGSFPLEDLTDAYFQFPDYSPCDSYGCRDRKGTVWMVQEPAKSPLTASLARKKLEQFFEKWRRCFRLATYPADTLSPEEIKSCLDDWERMDGFVPDVVVVDYADLLTADVREFRHRQDYIWKRLRALSQERHCLVLTATQSDAASYEKGRLSLSNFSEDKRKYSHVTAMYGLNQDPKGLEKKKGIMRINELVVREGDFSQANEVTVLQDLRIGRPFLESF